MTVEEPKKDWRTDLDRALKELLVGEVHPRVDPTTGEVITPDGEKSSLTGPEDPNTIR